MFARLWNSETSENNGCGNVPSGLSHVLSSEIEHVLFSFSTDGFKFKQTAAWNRCACVLFFRKVQVLYKRHRYLINTAVPKHVPHNVGLNISRETRGKYAGASACIHECIHIWMLACARMRVRAHANPIAQVVAQTYMHVWNLVSEHAYGEPILRSVIAYVVSQRFQQRN